MPEMVSYIFGTLRNNEAAVNRINRTLKAQYIFNKRVAFFSVAVTANVALLYLLAKEHEEKIKKLNDEIEKLKEPTESCEESTESTS